MTFINPKSVIKPLYSLLTDLGLKYVSTDVKVLQYRCRGTAVTLGRYSSTEASVLAMVPKGWIRCIRQTQICPLPHTSQVPVG